MTHRTDFSRVPDPPSFGAGRTLQLRPVYLRNFITPSTPRPTMGRFRYLADRPFKISTSPPRDFAPRPSPPPPFGTVRDASLSLLVGSGKALCSPNVMRQMPRAPRTSKAPTSRRWFRVHAGFHCAPAEESARPTAR
jgi:hypothetical protein